MRYKQSPIPSKTLSPILPRKENAPANTSAEMNLSN